MACTVGHLAALPVTLDLALGAAAEHFAFCPGNIRQSNTDTFPTYAGAIKDLNCWSF